MALGVDSTNRADFVPSQSGGRTSAQLVHDQWSNQASFWCRYFSPSGVWTGFDQFCFQLEMYAMSPANGFNYLVPLSSPGGSRTNGTQQMGSDDANALCAAIMSVVGYNGSPAVDYTTIWLSTNQVMSCVVYLDVEAGQGLSPSYWNGWCNAVRGRLTTVGSYSGYPFYPACYCAPNSASGYSGLTMAQMVVSNASAAGLWSATPEPGPCGMPGPAWNPDSYGGGPGYGGARLWQYIEDSPCGWLGSTTFADVDLNESTPAWDERVNMIYFSCSPPPHPSCP